MAVTSSQQRRLWIVVLGLAFAALIIVGRLIAFQVVQGAHWQELGEEVRRRVREATGVTLEWEIARIGVPAGRKPDHGGGA